MSIVPRKKHTGRLTPLELALMRVLWSESPLTLQEVHERLDADPPLAYTTVQTMLNVLHRKGHVKRELEGRGYRYRPATTRARAATQAVGDLIGQLFGGSVDDFVMAVLDHRDVDAAQVEKLARRVAKERKK